jgi:UDP-N-acetylmuramoyl-tripeptide--D-alanyl-D-alanine ligase
MKYPPIEKLYELFSNSLGVVTDSRKIVKDSLFFSLRGDAFNGNLFAESAIKQGAAYSVVDDEEVYPNHTNFIFVKNVLATLQALSCYHRTHIKATIIALTGSNGKTTTKELIRNVLSKKYKTQATQGNFNNHIGVPLTLLSIQKDIDFAIVEMGANHVGEIADLCRIALPDYGMITNIGKAHIGEFGSYENIITGKTEMYEHLKGNGKTIFVNADDALLVNKSLGIERVLYGTANEVFSKAKLLSSSPFLEILYNGKVIQSQIIGAYNFENIEAALCIGKYFGVKEEDIKNAIEEYVPENNRSQMVKKEQNEIILDAYNANPSSMAAAIRNFCAMKGENKWLLLGDMYELGSYEIEEHKNIIRLIEDCKFKQVILVGSKFEQAAHEGANRFPVFKTVEELLQIVQQKYSIKDALILIKGSRSMKLERLVDYF